MPPAQPSTLFPYTTLFRSAKRSGRLLVHRQPANEPDDQSHEDCAGNRAEDRRGNPAYEHGHVLHDVHSTTILVRSEEHTSELQSRRELVCRLLLEKKRA